MGFRRNKILDQIYIYANRSPTINDDITIGIGTGARWINEAALFEYVCMSDVAGAAVWVQTASGGGGTGFITRDEADAAYRAKSTYTHSQGLASTTWVIHHDLESRPIPLVFDSGGSQVIGEVTYTDINNLTITFAYPFSGVAYLG